MTEIPTDKESLTAELSNAIAEHMQKCRSWSVSSLASFMADTCINVGRGMRWRHEHVVKIEEGQAELRAMIGALPEPSSGPLEALQMASCYIQYVKERNPELHREADGSPSIDQAVNAAVAGATGKAA